jgi:hypothetical protein
LREVSVSTINCDVVQSFILLGADEHVAVILLGDRSENRFGFGVQVGGPDAEV